MLFGDIDLGRDHHAIKVEPKRAATLLEREREPLSIPGQGTNVLATSVVIRGVMHAAQFKGQVRTHRHAPRRPER